MPPLPEVLSLWRETAPNTPAAHPLTETVHCDIAIIGGGYTGLSTADALAARGHDVVVLEANTLGWGASGRNGGVVSGKFRLSFSDIAQRWGLDHARRMQEIGIEATEHIQSLIHDYDLEADYLANGSLRCAHRPEALAKLTVECEWLRETLGDRAVSMLDQRDMQKETASSDFCGGMLNQHGGIIHPLKFHQGLVSGLRRKGIRIAGHSAVNAIERQARGVTLHLDNGTLHAKQVVLATNGYSSLSKASERVRKKVVPFRSAMIATAPLRGTAAESLLSLDRSYSETRRMMRWFRRSGDRFIYGGRGAFGTEDSPSAFQALEKAMVLQFPQLAEVPVTHRWSGLVAMTMDSLPHLGRLDDRVVYAMGYNGSGVALSSYIGRHVADVLENKPSSAALIGSLSLANVPFYPMREIGVRLVAGWYQFLDAMGE